MGFKVLLQNIRSIQKIFDELEVFLHHLDTKPHIIALTETCTSEKTLKGSFQLTGYSKLITCDRESRGGVVGFLVSDELSVEILQKTTKRHQQILTVEIETGESKCLVTVLCKAPNYSIDNFTDDLIEHFENTKSDVNSRILCGDFNTDIRKLNKNISKLIEFFKLFDYRLKNSYDCTRETVNSQSAIDLFLLITIASSM